MSALAARVAAVVPCKDEADRIGATVAAVAALPQVGRVVVVDDGSTDGTADAARAAGADVVRHERNRGKAAALETGVRRVRELERADAVADSGRPRGPRRCSSSTATCRTPPPTSGCSPPRCSTAAPT